MKKKVALPLVITVVMVGALTYPVYKAYQPQEAMVVVDAPRECKIGELVTFDASESKMDSIVWNISPSTPNFKIIDDGKQAIFSSGKIGNYTITVAIANGKEVNLSIIKLTVNGATTTPLIDLINKDGVKNLIEDKLPDSVKQVINLDQVKNLLDAVLPDGNENLLPSGVKVFDANTGEILNQNEDKDEDEQVDILPWLPANLDRPRLNKMIGSLNILNNLMDTKRFETKDEIVQAVIWGVKRATQEDESWKPFILNLSKYLENSDSEQDCIQKVKAVLTSLKQINNEKT